MPWISLGVLTFVFVDFVARYPMALTNALHQPPAPLTGKMFPIVLVFFSSNIHATQVISWPDMMRFGKSVRAMLLGQLGLPVIYTITIVFGALMTGVVRALTGHSVYDPILLVAGYLHPVWITVPVLLCYAALLMNTNIFSNAVPPVYDLNNTWPKQLTWARGVWLVTGLGIAIGAWALYARGAYAYFNSWILFVASLLGPFSGVIVVDYVFIQRGHLNVADIYRIGGQYYFYRGVNIRAVLSVAVALFVVFMGHFGLSFPGWVYFSKASWLTGAVIAGVCYALLTALWRQTLAPKLHEKGDDIS